ncbi:hypothetical protein H1D32_16495 [Anaerobacillus sp. CMMVII]|uniref:hypothetical protein n=1 Tax=Anaerobacillus sp. CMMVII TaxID=2755588 RepID=UPI0021B83893|nr:hypothetical protein [Anaerobacillus sp. CMMVII]MCT8139162.1 hypothetical protein [Anaerobacillus sp. CMMVII]
MSCGCSSLEDGMAIVDHVRSKGKENQPPKKALEIPCTCGEVFTLEKVIMNCPTCGMTYGVTPCGSDDLKKVLPAGINYA